MPECLGGDCSHGAFLLISGLHLIPGLSTAALVSIAARYVRQGTSDSFELALPFTLGPHFQIAVIVA